MVDPDNIPYDSAVSSCMPRLITADDYHEFEYIENLLKYTLGFNGVHVSEVGFTQGFYVALVHLDTPDHRQMVTDLEKYYQEDNE